MFAEPFGSGSHWPWGEATGGAERLTEGVRGCRARDRRNSATVRNLGLLLLLQPESLFAAVRPGSPSRTPAVPGVPSPKESRTLCESLRRARVVNGAGVGRARAATCFGSKMVNSPPCLVRVGPAGGGFSRAIRRPKGMRRVTGTSGRLVAAPHLAASSTPAFSIRPCPQANRQPHRGRALAAVWAAGPSGSQPRRTAPMPWPARPGAGSEPPHSGRQPHGCLASARCSRSPSTSSI